MSAATGRSQASSQRNAQHAEIPVSLRLRIIMPVLNEGKTLARCLLALQPLRAQGTEVVVVDGGSSDDTWAIARALADQVLLAPRGRAAQMNAGARCEGHLRADVFVFLHADTRLPAQADGLISAALQSGANWGRFDVRLDSDHTLLRLVANMMNLRSRLTGIATGDQALFMRRDLFERVGGFANLPLMEDIELCSRLKKTSAPACLRQRVTTSARRWLQHGIWRTILLMWRLRLAYFLGASAHNLARRYGYAPEPALVPAAIAIMAKAPMPGLSKTRLMPALGPRGAARAQRRFTLNTLHLARQAALGAVTLHCAPDAQHRFFRALRRVLGVACEAQPDGDLGVRMLGACARHFARDPGQPLLLVGTDCAVLAPGHLQQAALALEQNNVVLIPAQDGGYVLIGMRSLVPEVFEDIAWSTAEVLAQTRIQLQRAAVSWQELPALWDVDEPTDWQRLQKLELGHE